jgi:hypothetical protein
MSSLAGVANHKLVCFCGACYQGIKGKHFFAEVQKFFWAGFVAFF